MRAEWVAEHWPALFAAMCVVLGLLLWLRRGDRR